MKEQNITESDQKIIRVPNLGAVNENEKPLSDEELSEFISSHPEEIQDFFDETEESFNSKR